MSTFTKDPEAVLDYYIDWSDWLDEDVISTSEWTVPAGITSVDGKEAATDTITTLWLSGGTAGTAYQLVNHIVTDDGREEDRTLIIVVKER